MFVFPEEGKAPQLRKTWIEQIGRREEDGTLWKPPKDARVCKKHFKDDSFIPFFPKQFERLSREDTTTNR